jgi:hypothetical protein
VSTSQRYSALGAGLEHLRTVMHLKDEADGDIEANRKYVSAMLRLQVWAHKLYECAESAPHESHHHSHIN